MTAIAKTGSTALAVMPDDELIDVLRSSLYPGASENSIKLVLGYCKAAGLDPMQKPVHIVPMWDSKAKQMRDVIMPGVGLYRTQAARTGNFVGQTEPEFGPMVTAVLSGVEVTYPDWARVTVKRLVHGMVAEFSAVEYWVENYAVKGGQEKSIAPNSMWFKRPRGQIAKCAAAQALRMAFPESTGSQPTADEMEGKSLNDSETGFPPAKDMGAVEVVTPTLPTCSDELFATRLADWHKAIDAGRATADGVVAKASTKYLLTEAQKAAIHAKPVQEPAVTVSYAMVADKLFAASSAQELDDAATLIGEVADPGLRRELSEKYEAMSLKLKD